MPGQDYKPGRPCSSKPPAASHQRRADGKQPRAGRGSETPPDTDEDEAALPEDCWLRPTLRPNRTLVVRNKYDSGSDTDPAERKAAVAAVGGMKTIVLPRREAMLQAMVDDEPTGRKDAAEGSEDDECRWGVRRRGPRECPLPCLSHQTHYRLHTLRFLTIC